MKRRDAVAVFGSALVDAAMADPAPVRLRDDQVRAVAELAGQHHGDDLPAFRRVLHAHLLTLTEAERLAVVRLVVGGVRAELRDVAANERRHRMH